MANQKISYLLILIAIVCGIFYFSNVSERRLSVEQRNSKEHFFDEEKKKFSFARLNRNISNQVGSILNFHTETILLPIQFKKQENRVTCEVAALRMSLNYLGFNVTETELLENIHFSATKPRSPENAWGDPQIGFVGDVNGSIFYGTGYGVYDKPIKNLAKKYTNAEIIEEPTLSKILEHAQNGRPVIVWGLLSTKNNTYWASYEDTLVKAFFSEHARVVIGYTGKISDPHSIILMDPLYGKVSIETKKFLTEWALLDHMAVVVGLPDKAEL